MNSLNFLFKFLTSNEQINNQKMKCVQANPISVSPGVVREIND